MNSFIVFTIYLEYINGGSAIISFVRVGYCIPVPDFYLVLHGLRCLKSTI